MTGSDDRLRGIVETAERLSAEIRAEIEAAATEHADARMKAADRMVDEKLEAIAHISATVSAQVVALRNEAQTLLDELDRARVRLEALRSGEAPTANGAAPAAADDNTVRDLEPIAYPGTGGERATSAERARRRAAQMAAAGVDPGEIERILRAGFGIQDPGGIVEEALGMAAPGSAGSTGPARFARPPRTD